MTTAPPGVGRDRELQVIADLLGRVEVRGGALVVQGDPGIGKSFLLEDAAQRARRSGFRVLRTTGVESEAALPFAGLHELLIPVLSAADSLPGPQRLALLTAFGMAESAAPDPYLVALAALELLAEAAAAAPLLVLAEDAHWLDAPTCQALAFVARRLASEPIVLLAALRPAPRSPLLGAGLDEMILSGLDDEAAARLLRAKAPRLSAAVRDSVLVNAVGNPLALLELPVAMDGSLVAGLPTDAAPLTVRLERAFATRLAELPAPTRAVLVAAAVDDRDDLEEILRAASWAAGSDIGAEALGPAIRAGLIRDADDPDTVTFRHPLVRSATRREAGEAEIRRNHDVLAALVANEPDRRAWHRAAAAALPDEEVALELEAAAGRARARGGATCALAAQRRAAQLTPDRSRRGGRLLDAAETAYEVGDHALAESLRGKAEALPLDLKARSRAAWLRGAFDDGQPGDTAGMRELIDLAERSRREGHTDVALQLLFGAARRCWWGEPGPDVRRALIETAERLHIGMDDPRMLAVIAITAPLERGAEIIRQLADRSPTVDADPAAAGMVAMAALVVGDFEYATTVISEIIKVLRDEGRLGLLSQFLLLNSVGAFCLGDLDVSRQSAEEATTLAQETGQPVWAALAQRNVAALAALCGDFDSAESRLEPVARGAFASGNASILNGVLLARGLIALGREQYDIAYEHLSRMFDVTDPAYHPVQHYFQLGYLAEAALHSGNQRRAKDLLAQIAPRAQASGSPGIGIAMRHARALLADDDVAEAEYKAALASDNARWPYHRARLELAYGRWLRRQRRVMESREPLRAAANTFDLLGVRPWADRARRELDVAGEAGRAPEAGGWDLLSPQERQIAGLVAEGLTNREIAQRLYLSHRTIDSHLYRIFPKLGISSRTQLVAMLDRRAQA
jgi:DNA-binding CsgD family transcriptional regulator